MQRQGRPLPLIDSASFRFRQVGEPMPPMPPRRTAIVATLGPVSETRSSIESLVAAGMDMVRLSMSNGSRERHAATVRLVREAAQAQNRQVRIMADLQGRKNRIGCLPGGSAVWAEGEKVTFTAEPGDITSHQTWLIHGWSQERVSYGSSILVDDGAIVLTVTQTDSDRLHCQVVEGGPVTEGRGACIPGATSIPNGLIPKDADDLRFAQELGVEVVALSFACSAKDYDEIRTIAPDAQILGKIEHMDAVESLTELVSAYDGLMVARGDLALEIPFESVPMVQKQIIAECAVRGRTSMVATQLLHSMRENALPTRAEVSDVANAVLDGADSLLMTGETGYGRHPVRAVEVMRRIIERTERYQRDGISGIWRAETLGAEGAAR